MIPIKRKHRTRHPRYSTLHYFFAWDSLFTAWVCGQKSLSQEGSFDWNHFEETKFTHPSCSQILGQATPCHTSYSSIGDWYMFAVDSNKDLRYRLQKYAIPLAPLHSNLAHGLVKQTMPLKLAKILGVGLSVNGS
ncbi:hypothetical protein PT974_00964 [Cladobotryum mycophilum]|uniref:Uncharacterized protein n=1 Tax=Cladobotryum mycophilum TaxID=491253 RepID=A0ABR0T2G2_9HYPO